MDELSHFLPILHESGKVASDLLCFIALSVWIRKQFPKPRKKTPLPSLSQSASAKSFRRRNLRRQGNVGSTQLTA